MREIAAAVALALISLGCSRVQSGDLVGTWTMTAGSREIVPASLHNVSGRLVLNPDGTFVASDLPGLFFFPGRRNVRAESGNGTWKLASDEGRAEVRLVFIDIADWNHASLPFGTQLTVSFGWPRVNLSYFIGDADEGSRVYLERASPARH